MYVTGNVAYRKRDGGFFVGGVTEGLAVDGNIDQDVENDDCFVSSDDFWFVSLREQHVIYNMTLYTSYTTSSSSKYCEVFSHYRRAFKIMQRRFTWL